MKELKEVIYSSSVKLNNTKKKIKIISFFRMITFMFFLLELYYAVSKSSNIIYHLIIGLFFLITFISLVFYNSDCIKIINFNENLQKICLDIIEENPNDFNIDIDLLDQNHSYCFDLDIFGKKSLFEKISRVQTSFGNKKLINLLLNNILESKEIIKRQESIQEISTKICWAVNFLATIRNKRFIFDEKTIDYSIDLDNFNSKGVKIILVVIPVINIILICNFLILNFTIYSFLLLFIPLIIRFFVYHLYARKVNFFYAFITKKYNNLSHFTNVFSVIEDETFSTIVNIDLQKHLKSGKNVSASKVIKKLGYLIDKLENKNLPIVGFLLNVVFQWDLQFASKIENYISFNKKNISKWFEVLGEFEALTSFGIFAYRNPEYVYPLCSNLFQTMELKDIKHPLISKREVVNNDIIINNHNIVIITGANMTGKSTFLRALGINLVLAMNGCPVSASYFSFYPINIFTSMRTSDSLVNGSSYFNAEIKRLKLLVDKLENSEPQFIILDEILKGTNSIDKLKGSEKFLKKIIKTKTSMSCIIATHDIELTKIESRYPSNIKNYCFELQRTSNSLKPDFKLRKGVTKSMNAIFLMRELKIID